MKVKKKIFVAPLFKKEYNLAQLLRDKYNNMQNKIAVINVVGTNGKGSVAHYLQKQLMANNNMVGLFTSPAFLSHNERIKIDNNFISDKDLQSLLKELKHEIKEYKLTFFEIWVLICICYFISKEIKIAVIEAGIGGKYDSTSVFNNQIAVLLTSIDYDHTEILGNSLEEIIENKIGILKGNNKLFISASCQKYLGKIQKEVGDNQIIVSEIYLKAINYYQEFNVGLVIKFLEEFNWTINYDLFRLAPLLGRFTQLSKNPYFIIDGAHNIEGLQACIHTFEQLKNIDRSKVIVLFASAAKKDYLKNFALLKEHFGEQLYITSFKHPLAWKIDEIDYHQKIMDWKKFLRDNKSKNILVCGSLYFIPLVYKFYLERM